MKLALLLHLAAQAVESPLPRDEMQVISGRYSSCVRSRLPNIWKKPTAEHVLAAQWNSAVAACGREREAKVLALAQYLAGLGTAKMRKAEERAQQTSSQWDAEQRDLYLLSRMVADVSLTVIHAQD